MMMPINCSNEVTIRALGAGQPPHGASLEIGTPDLRCQLKSRVRVVTHAGNVEQPKADRRELVQHLGALLNPCDCQARASAASNSGLASAHIATAAKALPRRARNSAVRSC